MWTYVATDYNNDYTSYLVHHCILGQKWGIRRYQNEDGSLTPLGRKRYGVGESGEITSKKGIKNALNDTEHALGLIYDKLKHDKKLTDSERKKLIATAVNGENAISQYLNQANKMGYNVKASTTIIAAQTRQGRSAVASFIASGATSLLASAIIKTPVMSAIVVNPTTATQKYRLRNNKDGNPTVSYSKSSQKLETSRMKFAEDEWNRVSGRNKNQ